MKKSPVKVLGTISDGEEVRMIFQGKVSSRSGNTPAHSISPPGERRLQELFPDRYEKIAHAAGWDRIHPGSLNVDVHKSFYDEVWGLRPAYKEPGDSVPYPAPFERIPVERREYRYYAGLILYEQKSAEVFFRRPLVASEGLSSHNVWRFDVFAQISLRETLGVDDRNIVSCIAEDWAGGFPNRRT